ncbi:IclR family transcriptional regulator domain-containing protein [Sphaerimonospora thailandensis]|uniref:Transcriptional regulator n=1 Tax=Sphaerimonospora thailandensis TaxID=795644 RepID=A0A8J3W017_9ACTN|nr:IclR family transcriptional regulator C-terminal domain-containing protein [Sphaerimonospora thailandensis]GIH70623.1 transcriptional regulator [Sphaerimonospora thailandensis]
MTEATTGEALPAGDPPKEAVGPLIRGLAVIRRLSLAGGRRTVSDLTRDAGLARSTVDRVLGTLVRLGYVRPAGRDAVLAPALMELGNAYLAASRLPGLLGPYADRLADELDESVSLAVPDADGVRFVHQAPRRRRMTAVFRVGDLLPAECAAPGALFAADWSPAQWERWRLRVVSDPGYAGFPVLPPDSAHGADSFEDRAAQARQKGWSADDQLIEPGLVAVALPVRDATGRAVCAVSVVSHTSRHDAASLCAAMPPRLRETAAAMEHALTAPPALGPVGTARTRLSDEGPELVESLARGLAVLTGFTTAAMSLSALAEATGLPRATVRRALITLAHLGYVAAEDRLFRLTPRVLDLGYACLARLTLPQIAQPHLTWLAGEVRDSASMAILAGDDIRYVARVPTERIMSVDITVGTRFPAYATSMGRVLLAGLGDADRAAYPARADLRPLTRHTVTSPVRLAELLDQVRRDGYALVDQELEEGLRSIAVPVRDRAGEVVAAVNVSTHAHRQTAEGTREAVLPQLREAAARIEHDLHIATRFARIPTA